MQGALLVAPASSARVVIYKRSISAVPHSRGLGSLRMPRPNAPVLDQPKSWSHVLISRRLPN